jgi:hypothetical protein
LTTPYFPKAAAVDAVVAAAVGAGGMPFSAAPPFATTLSRASRSFSEREEEEYDAAERSSSSSSSSSPALRDLDDRFFSFPLRFLS